MRYSSVCSLKQEKVGNQTRNKKKDAPVCGALLNFCKSVALKEFHEIFVEVFLKVNCRCDNYPDKKDSARRFNNPGLSDGKPLI